jgi:NAD(P)H-dependent FMN reductase
MGTALAQAHLRNVLAYMDVPLMGQPEMFIRHDAKKIDASGKILDDDTRKFLQVFVDKIRRVGQASRRCVSGKMSATMSKTTTARVAGRCANQSVT